MLCVVYVIGITICLACVGLLAEQALPANVPRRWIWVGAISLSTTLPPLYRLRHSAVIHGGAILHASGHDEGIGRLVLLSTGVAAALAVMQAAWTAARVRRARVGPDVVVDGVDAIVTRAVGPATVGIVRARVVVPRWVLALPAAQRRYVLRHEEEHRRSRDTLVLCLAALAGVLTPWNLPLWWQLRRLHDAVELDCDRRVVAALGDARAYGAMLLGVAEASRRGRAPQPALLGTGALEGRIAALVAPSSRTVVRRVAAAAAAAALLAAVLLLPHPLARH